MASTLSATALSPSARFAFPSPTPPALALFSGRARPFSLAANLSSPPPIASLLLLPPLRSRFSLVARRWKLPAAASEKPVETEEEDEEETQPAVPEPVEVQLAASIAGEAAKGEDVFAVVMIGSRQYIVFPGRFIYTQRLKGANVNDKIILNKVLLVGTRTKTYIGQPIVTNAAVHAVVEEQGLNRKVIVFKYKKKKNYRRNIGHRQPNTRIRITGITGYQDFPFETLPETLPA